MANKKTEQELIEENKRLRELLKETLPAMCDWRFEHGRCAKCNTEMYCISKKVMPKVEKELGIKNI